MNPTKLSLLLSLIALWLGATLSAIAADGTHTNAAVTRHWVGEYRNETIATGERRGSERFELLVHPDGSRTISIASDMTTRNAWFTVVLRNDANFRPLEASAFYWNGGRYKGSGHFLVMNDLVRGESNGPVRGQHQRDHGARAIFDRTASGLRRWVAYRTTRPEWRPATDDLTV